MDKKIINFSLKSKNKSSQINNSLNENALLKSLNFICESMEEVNLVYYKSKYRENDKSLYKGIIDIISEIDKPLENIIINKLEEGNESLIQIIINSIDQIKI